MIRLRFGIHVAGPSGIITIMVDDVGLSAAKIRSLFFEPLDTEPEYTSFGLSELPTTSDDGELAKLSLTSDNNFQLFVREDMSEELELTDEWLALDCGTQIRIMN